MFRLTNFAVNSRKDLDVVFTLQDIQSINQSINQQISLTTLAPHLLK